MLKAFQDAKAALAEATMLTHPHKNAPTALVVDASNQAVGAALQQLVHGAWQPLAFFSKQLRPTEKKYSRELLVLYLDKHHFRYMYFLEGQEFIVYMDHKPLTFCISKISDPWTNRQQQHLACISEFSTDIRQVKGKKQPRSRHNV